AEETPRCWRPYGAVLETLEDCYAEVLMLEKFVQLLQKANVGTGASSLGELLQDGDDKLFRTFVSQCVVCVPHGAKVIPQPLTFQQLSRSSEVALRVVQRICERKKKNVLAFGYALLDENRSRSELISVSKIYNHTPNSTTETICCSVLWETLLSRIGDDVMMYLLEHCAIFRLVPPSCCYQICGQPIYELTPSKAVPSPVFVRQRNSQPKGNILSDYIKKKILFPKKYLSKTNWWKWKPSSVVELDISKSEIGSVHVKEAKDISLKQRGAKIPAPDFINKSSNKISFSMVHIKRRFFLYSHRRSRECFPKTFLLNHLKHFQAGGQRLVEAIFLNSNVLKQKCDQNPPGLKWRKKRLPKRYWQMRHVFQELLQNHAKCPYLLILKKNCPRQISRNYSTFGVRELLKQHSSHWQVYIFVRECLERVVPAELWGSNHNKCRFLKNVKKCISLGKFATFSLQELMWKMRVNDCTWLRLVKHDHFVPAMEHCFREEMLAKFLYWLMDSYVTELLRSFFYITETMFQKNMLFFYRKTIWNELEKTGIKKHLTKVSLHKLSAKEIQNVQQKKWIPLASKLRFIPKPDGLRPIVKLNGVVGEESFSRESKDKKVHYFNNQLKNLFSVLNYERTVKPSFLGSTVFGRDDIYQVWKKFVLKVLEPNGEMPCFYFVKADVTGAYDTIPHDKLVKVVSQVLGHKRETSYRIRCYGLIKRTMNGQIRKCYRRHASACEDFMPTIGQFVSCLQDSESLQNAIVVEQSISLNETSSSLLAFFLQMIRNNILKIGDEYYVQCCGIPQGSVLSTLLCNLCYGNMEVNLFCGVQQGGVLMRLTDDFLLVTPHLTEAKFFLRTLAIGIPEYGFLINPSKTVVNFPVDEDIPGCSKFKQLPARCVIPWCGLLLDTQTLEVYCDYSSYAGTSIRSSLTFNSSCAAGKNMKCKLITVLLLKCHSLFLDLQINSLKTVCINIYKIFLLQAYRFHACVLQLPFNQQVRNNPCFFLKIISDTTSCCYSVLKTRNAGIALATKGASGFFPYETAQWLCYHAFIFKLSNHKAIYKCLLKPLKICELQLLKKIPKTTMQLLQEATEPSLCNDFKAILD
uniref:Telomerase reverse transcriptase n=1 Tax=Sphenodon punctatus TaxID=8508 RepID=A0A8D0GHQ8_SPHPU